VTITGASTVPTGNEGCSHFPLSHAGLTPLRWRPSSRALQRVIVLCEKRLARKYDQRPNTGFRSGLDRGRRAGSSDQGVALHIPSLVPGISSTVNRYFRTHGSSITRSRRRASSRDFGRITMCCSCRAVDRRLPSGTIWFPSFGFSESCGCASEILHAHFSKTGNHRYGRGFSGAHSIRIYTTTEWPVVGAWMEAGAAWSVEKLAAAGSTA